MSVQRIDHPQSFTHGYQARAYVPGAEKRRLTIFFSDKAHGGQHRAHRLASLAEQNLKRRVKLLGDMA